MLFGFKMRTNLSSKTQAGYMFQNYRNSLCRLDLEICTHVFSREEGFDVALQYIIAVGDRMY